MAIPVDPCKASFVDTVIMQGGRYNGRTVGEVGASPKGILFLYELSEFPPPGIGQNLMAAIKRYLARPENIAMVKRAIQEIRPPKPI